MGPRGLSPQPGLLYENEHPQRGERTHPRTTKPLTGEEVKAHRIKLSPEKIAPWWQMLRAFLIARVPELKMWSCRTTTPPGNNSTSTSPR